MPALARNRASQQTPSIFRIQNVAGSTPTIQLFGDIGQSVDGDWFWDVEGGAGTFKEFCEELAKIGNAPELRVEIHSYGGSVIVGKAIHDKLVEHPAKKTAIIYGICASAATYPALACQEIEIPANSFFLIHNSSGYCVGDAKDMQRMADNLVVSDDSIAALYAARTGMSEAEIREIMDADTWMTGDEAVELGLATKVIEPVTIKVADRVPAQNFRSTALNEMPDEARAWFDKSSLAIAKRFSNRATTLPPSNAMTAEELKAAEKKLADEKAAFEKTKNDHQEEAKKILDKAKADAAEITNKAGTTTPTPTTQPAPTDLSKTITDAVSSAIKPLQDEITDLKNKQAQGVDPKNLGGAQPTGEVKQPEGEEKPDFSKMSSAELINLGRKNAAAARDRKPVPVATA